MDFRIAVKAFTVTDDRLLIVKRRSDDPHAPSAWDIPGGRLEPGEDPYEGLRREVSEETGIDVDVLTVMNIHHFVRDDGQTITMLIFLCKPHDDTIVLSAEHSEHEWIPIEKCTEKLDQHFHEDVEAYRSLGLKRFV